MPADLDISVSHHMPAELLPTPINGVFELRSHSFVDSRGAFLNAFRAHEKEFLAAWGARGIAQVNLSRTESVGTIRGLHLQGKPHSEAKLVRCLKGNVWDVAVDLRPDSTTYGKRHAVQLSPELGNALLIGGCAHASRCWRLEVNCFIYIPVLGCRRRRGESAGTIPNWQLHGRLQLQS